ncbi:MAG: rhodanese-like domain-containing protein [Thermotogae bacterium]|nr:rhodanese-like domain-containing protein [Thermotogota bacterium]
MVWILYAAGSLDSLAITPDSAERLRGKVLFLDVRSPSFFKKAPLRKDAYNLPLSDILEGFNPPRDYDFYVTLCSCPKGGIAKRAAELLRTRGFKAFYVVR